MQSVNIIYILSTYIKCFAFCFSVLDWSAQRSYFAQPHVNRAILHPSQNHRPTIVGLVSEDDSKGYFEKNVFILSIFLMTGHILFRSLSVQKSPSTWPQLSITTEVSEQYREAWEFAAVYGLLTQGKQLHPWRPFQSISADPKKECKRMVQLNIYCVILWELIILCKTHKKMY